MIKLNKFQWIEQSHTIVFEQAENGMYNIQIKNSIGDISACTCKTASQGHKFIQEHIN